jgi:hypothetical protein
LAKSLQEVQKQEREKRIAAAEREKEDRKGELERHREAERVVREQQKVAQRLAERHVTVDDVDLIVIRGDDEDLRAKYEVGQCFLVEPECGLETDLMPDSLIPSVLEVWEFTNFFSSLLGCKKLTWVQFLAGITDPDCTLFHGMNVALVRILFEDVQPDGGAFKGRPLNSLTWPELLRNFLIMIQIEHTAENIESLSNKMQIPDMIRALESRR